MTHTVYVIRYDSYLSNDNLKFLAFQKNGENLIYTAHGLLAVTSDSGVFSPHQLILFSASFSLRQKLKK